MLAIVIIAVVIAAVAIAAIVAAWGMKGRMCIWIDRKGNVQIIASGSPGSIARDTNKVHLFLIRRIAESDSISKKIIEGRWEKAEQRVIGITE